MKAKPNVRAPYLGPVTLWQSFLVLFLAGPLTGFGVAVWNAFFLDCRLRWRHLAVALVLCLALSLFRIHMVPGLVMDLVLATGWDGQTASHLVWLASASVESALRVFPQYHAAQALHARLPRIFPELRPKRRVSAPDGLLRLEARLPAGVLLAAGVVFLALALAGFYLPFALPFQTFLSAMAAAYAFAALERKLRAAPIEASRVFLSPEY